MTRPTAQGIPRDARDPSTYFHRRRPLFWCALAWMSGILLDDALKIPGDTLALCAFFLASAGIFSLLDSARRIHAQLALALVAFAGGMLTHAVFARSTHLEFASIVARQGNACQLVGVVVQAQPTRYGGARWVLQVEQVEDGLGAQRVQSRVQLFVRTPPPEVQEGSRVRLNVTLTRPRDTLPDGFDAVAYLSSNGIHHVGELGVGQRIGVLEPALNPLLHARRFSHELSARLGALFPALTLEGRESGSQAALLNALLFGRREFLDRADRDAFAATGTAHLLAISGLQIQFLAWLFWNAARLAGVPRRVNALLLFAATWFYTALSGAEPPIVRAAVMISLALIGQWAARESDPLNLLGAAAILILAFDPGQLFQAGFQLSFSAVFALIVLVPLFNDALKRRAQQDPLAQLHAPAPHSLRRHLGDLALVSFAAWLATAPVIAWHMKQFSILCVPVNLLAVPLSAMAMVCGLGALFCSVVPPLAALFTWAAFALLALLQALTDLASAVPYSTLQVSRPHTLLLLLLASAILLVWILRASTRLPLLAAGLCALVIFSVGAHPAPAPPQAPTLTFLDLPRGRAILLQNGTDAVLIEAGGPSSAALVGNVLERQGVRRLKAAVALESGYYNVGGLAGVLRALPAERVLLPRDLSPSTARLALESTLRDASVPWSSDPRSIARDLLPGFTLEFVDDSSRRLESRSGTSVLAARIACGSSTLLLLPTPSDASLQRLVANAPPEFFTVSTLGLCDSSVPERLKSSVFSASSPARVLDLSDVESRSIEDPHFTTFLNPYRTVLTHSLDAGSLRITPAGQAGAGKDDTWNLSVFQNGQWLWAK